MSERPLGPLEPREHVDLDSGTTVRLESDPSEFHVYAHDRGMATLDRDEIRAIAELAGFTVIGDDDLDAVNFVARELHERGDRDLSMKLRDVTNTLDRSEE